MSLTYKTVKKEFTFKFKEKGSSFIAFLFPVKTEEDFKKRLQELKTEFPDATHHCYAFRLDKEGILARSSDDGEPSGTAGKPIMNQLLSANLSYCALVVVRYFGGTKLGTGGLIKAYKESAKIVIDGAEIKEEKEKINYSVKTKFERSGEVLRLLNRYEAEITQKEANESLVFHFSIPLETVKEFKQKMNEIKDTEIL
jgi:uncharacterized YigZ family protein